MSRAQLFYMYLLLHSSKLSPRFSAISSPCTAKSKRRTQCTMPSTGSTGEIEHHHPGQLFRVYHSNRRSPQGQRVDQNLPRLLGFEQCWSITKPISTATSGRQLRRASRLKTYSVKSICLTLFCKWKCKSTKSTASCSRSSPIVDSTPTTAFHRM